ncbi:MAG TPA: hypothetical protein VFQ45_17690, partial [Longimicrobium sp.]|nr:hypothetical protein [Longimicrobium sp.]
MSGRGREALDGAPREDRASPGGRRAAREAADAQGAGAGVPRFLRGAVAEAPAFTPTGLSIQRAPAYGAAAALPAPPPSYAPPSPAAEA